MDFQHFSSLLAVATMSLLAAISPGPDFVVVVRNSLKHSRTAGQATALGIALGLFIHLTYTLVGLAVLITESPFTYNLLRYSGAAYLGYIGIKAVLSSFKGTSSLDLTYEKSSKGVTNQAMVWQGFLTNTLNPKCAVFFVSLFSQFITPETPVFLRLEYALVNWSITLGWFLFLAYVITAKALTAKLTNFGAYIDRAMGGALVLLSAKLLLV